ncbi:MAG TPA: zinc ribbon domain-containing protein [Solirubrobacteraceae bacterium]|nr:zinc ribbon domain-containing protein [Solirubrobacteraceae bacterium]
MTGITAERDALPRAFEDSCSHCGSELADGQEWCHECGAARTLIHRPPDWRIGLAIVGVVAAVAVLVFVLVLSNVSSSGSSSPTARASATTIAPPSKQTATGAVPGWPVGLGGWTVALGAGTSHAAADTRARAIAADGVQVGVLDSNLHPALRPGHWIVFSGRYPTKAQARAAAAQLVSLGHAHAHALLVGRPA